jgi:Tfp pilus assembly protein PilN
MALREINLVPFEFLHKKGLIRHLFAWTVCLTLSLSLIIAVYLYCMHVVLSPKQPPTTLEDVHIYLGESISQINETRDEIERLSQQESFLRELTKNQPFSVLLLKLSDLMNAQTWLSQLVIDAGTDKDDDPSMRLTGFSLSNEELGNFLNQLSSEPLFKAVVLKFAKETEWVHPTENQKESGRVRVIQFQIDCNIPRV